MTPPPLHLRRSWLTSKGMLRVPQIGVAFWVIKALSTAFGEVTSDYLVHVMAEGSNNGYWALEL